MAVRQSRVQMTARLTPPRRRNSVEGKYSMSVERAMEMETGKTAVNSKFDDLPKVLQVELHSFVKSGHMICNFTLRGYHLAELKFSVSSCGINRFYSYPKAGRLGRHAASGRRYFYGCRRLFQASGIGRRQDSA